MAGAARELGFSDPQSCARMLLSEPLTQATLATLASHLTVGETYFFRDGNTFSALEEHILPELLRERLEAGRRLRIWCAGCCTGEEPYSIAMLLDRLLPDAEAWNITILGTDINPHFLRKAGDGVYGEWSFRDAPAWVRDRYFVRRRDGCHVLQPRIRRKVMFSRLNLADDDYPSLATNTTAMDVILCRNVLMYFTEERARRVAHNLRRALNSGGWLVVGPAETSNTLFEPLVPVQLPGILVYRNTSVASPQAIATALAPPEPAGPHEDGPPAAPAPRASSVRPAGPGDPDEQIRAARRCAGEGRLDEAAAWCQKALEAERLNPVLHFLLGNIRQEQGQIEAAAQSFAGATFLDPEFALAHFALGNLCRARGRHAQARRHLDNALRLLAAYPHDAFVPEAEGLTAGRLVEMIACARTGSRRAVA